MTRVALISKRGRFSPDDTINVENYFKISGRNTGNNAFFYAVNKLIDGEKTFFDWSFDPKELNTKFDVAVFVAANNINNYSNFGTLPDRIESLKIPLVVIGLGAQAPSTKHSIEVTDGVKRLLEAFKAKATVIGTRGAFTLNYLQENGFEQALMSGCPSNLISSNRELGTTIASKIKPRFNRLAVAIDLTSKFVHIAQKFRNMMTEAETIFICQDPYDLILLSMCRLDGVSDKYKDTIKQYFALENDDELIRFCARHLYTFFDFEHGMHHAKNFDYSYGTKMHGNMMFHQSGTPAIFVPHDSRTDELIAALKLPHVPQARMNPKYSFKDDLNHIVFDPTAYNDNRRHLAGVIKGMFDKAGVPVSEHLKTLAS